MGSCGGQGDGKFRTGFVGQVPTVAQDTVLQGVGIGTVPKPVHIVIGLDQRQIGAKGGVHHQAGHSPQVGGDDGRVSAAGQPVAHAVGGVVGGGEGLDGQAPHLELTARRQGVNQLSGVGQLSRQHQGGAWGGVKGNGVVFQQDSQSCDVVSVFVGDQDAGQILRRQFRGLETLFDLSAGDAGVHQQGGVLVVEQRAVPTGAAGESTQMQGWLPPYAESSKKAAANCCRLGSRNIGFTQALSPRPGRLRRRPG